MSEKTTLRRAIRTALASGLTASACVAAGPALAQEEDILEAPRVEVTGSRIRRSNVETSSPVTTITREQIDATGEISISEVLRRLPQNTFGSFHERSGGGAEGGDRQLGRQPPRPGFAANTGSS